MLRALSGGGCFARRFLALHDRPLERHGRRDVGDRIEVSGARDPQRPVSQDPAEDALLDLDRLDPVDVQFEGLAPDKPEFGDDANVTPASGWIRDKGIVGPTSAGGDEILRPGC